MALLSISIITMLVLPTVSNNYIISLLIEILIFSIFAMSLDILIGYTGLPSLGHSAFFGLGSYIIAFLNSNNAIALNVSQNILITLPIVIFATGIMSFVIGIIAIRTKGIYFLMITLAFAQMLYSISIRWSSVTGGSDGITGILRPNLVIGSWMLQFDSRISFYYLVVAIFFITIILLNHIVNSPFGNTLKGIKSNQQRMLSLGYNVNWYKTASFVISGVIAGISGMLLAQFYWFTSPENIYWTMSGQALIMVVLGGNATLIGPIIGATLMRLLPNVTSSITIYWQSYMGLILIAVVLYARNGIVGTISKIISKKHE